VQSDFAGPLVRLYLDDARHVLSSEPDTLYDLIVMDSANLWAAGSSDLYSREFYQLAHSRLRTGGQLQQGVPLEHLGPREVASILASAHEAFRSVGLWSLEGQGLLLAGDANLAPPAGTVLLRDPNAVTTFVHEIDPPVNTDQNRWLEYAAPRYQVK
jgi:spermidine synthase